MGFHELQRKRTLTQLASEGVCLQVLMKIGEDESKIIDTRLLYTEALAMLYTKHGEIHNLLGNDGFIWYDLQVHSFFFW